MPAMIIIEYGNVRIADRTVEKNCIDIPIGLNEALNNESEGQRTQVI